MTAEELRKLVRYDPETGTLTSLHSAVRRKVGATLGSVTRFGHLRVKLKQRAFLVHRLAWLYVHGSWPEHSIDHINGNPADNRIANLRDVAHQTNIQNQHSATLRSSSGLAGIYFHKRNRQWKACIMVSGKTKHLGGFESPELAHAAYLAAKRALHDGCTI